MYNNIYIRTLLIFWVPLILIIGTYQEYLIRKKKKMKKENEDYENFLKLISRRHFLTTLRLFDFYPKLEYKQIKRSLGINNKLISSLLKILVDYKYLYKEISEDYNVRVFYKITKKGVFIKNEMWYFNFRTRRYY